MGAELAAPEATNDPEPTGTPETEPAEASAESQPQDQPAAQPDHALGQAEYTRSQQAFAALKERLGLPRTASRDEVLAAVDQLTNGSPDDEGNDEDFEEPELPQEYLDRLAAAEEAAYNASIDTMGAIYGSDMVVSAIEVANVIRSTDDPREIVTALAAFRGIGDEAPAAAGGQGEEPEGSPAVPPPVGLSEGDSGSPARQPISGSQARREPGTVQAIRGLFEAAGIQSRNRQQ